MDVTKDQIVAFLESRERKIAELEANNDRLQLRITQLERLIRTQENAAWSEADRKKDADAEKTKP